MKKFLQFFLIFALCLGTSVQYSYAQGDNPEGDQIENTDPNATTDGGTETEPEPAPSEPETAPVADNDAAVVEEDVSMHQTIKRYFIEGGWQFMMIVLIPLILGLAIAIERVITLSLATVNTKKFMVEIEDYVKKGNFKAATQLCKATPGPTAEVIGEGLKRVNEGVDMVEKTIVANGSVQTGLLEKGLVWLSLFIALAPMLGFMGTVIGMIQAFDAIERAGDIKPSDVAGGIKVALLTTVFGLIVAMILQFFYNLITSKIDGLVNGMEDSTIALIDVLVDNGYAKGAKAEA